jgi:hypothetical protein
MLILKSPLLCPAPEPSARIAEPATEPAMIHPSGPLVG